MQAFYLSALPSRRHNYYQLCALVKFIGQVGEISSRHCGVILHTNFLDVILCLYLDYSDARPYVSHPRRRLFDVCSDALSVIHRHPEQRAELLQSPVHLLWPRKWQQPLTGFVECRVGDRRIAWGRLGRGHVLRRIATIETMLKRSHILHSNFRKSRKASPRPQQMPTSSDISNSMSADIDMFIDLVEFTR